MQSPSRPLSPVRALPVSTESTVYGLFALAIALTTLGAYAGLWALASSPTLAGLSMVFLLAELVLIITSAWWTRTSPLNYILFAVFPLLSGFTLVPFILSVLQNYENGAVIVLNALAATASMALAGAVAVRLLKWDFSWMGRSLFFALIGLIVLGLLQLFVPSLRASQSFELLFSGIGVVLFAVFTAFDLQRIQTLGRAGANPFLLALSLYLDIFNLFLYVLRFMTALSGNRR